MLNIVLFIFFLFQHSTCLNTHMEINNTINEKDTININDIGYSTTQFIKYKKDTELSFKIDDDKTYQINIRSINCNIKIDFQGEIINKINLDNYSLKMNKNHSSVVIKPIIDTIDGEEKENYEHKSCPLSISSINENKSELKIENKTDTFFFFGNSSINFLNISYEIKEISNDNFAALFFQFNEKSHFLINVFYKNETNQVNIISKNIYESTYIFLNSETLNTASNSCLQCNLNININKLDYKDIKMNFKIIEKDMVSMIEKNALNYGFITSKNQHQYFYMEVFEEEEGELMLHNKRLYGELHAKIVHKSEINEKDLNDISKYPNKTDNNLIYNSHSLQLKYINENTKNCSNGCYILITYEQTQSEEDFPLMGYEFTILSRFWNYTDYISQIVDIPFNEYLIGEFEKESITHHYYSIAIPDDAEKIIIQIEGNYIDGFYGRGRKKINTMKGNVGKLDIINNQNVLTLNKSDISFEEKVISFAIRPKDYFSDIFSFYYFRILYIKKNEILYLPMDSHFGNLCLPEYDDNTDSFNCYSTLTNNYNELSANFSVSSSNQNEYFTINVTKVDKEGLVTNETQDLIYLKNDGNNNISHYLFTFVFKNNEIRNILSSFGDKIKNISPQIYSPQMFYLIYFNKTTHFRVSNNYTLSYKYIFGSTGWIDLSFLGSVQVFHSNKNFKGRPFAFPIDSETEYINFYNLKGEIMFYFQLLYNRKNQAIDEIKSGETISQIMNQKYLPLLYYVQIKNKEYANIDVNIRLNSYNESVMQNNFEIKGYMLNEETIKRKIDGEYIQLKDSINGTYSEKFKIGLLQVNRKIDNDNYFLLIEILNNDQTYITSYLMIDIVTKEYNEDIYYMPINHYIIETFDGSYNTIRKENQYYINVNQREVNDIIIDFSPEYNDIDLNFRDLDTSHYSINSVTGFKKYRIRNEPFDKIYFNVTNKNNRLSNYMIRYFFSTETLEQNYFLDNYTDQNIDFLNDDYVTVSLKFNGIQIKTNGITTNRSDIIFYINGLLFKNNENSEELLNTTSILQEKIPLYETKTKHNYIPFDTETFILKFENISRNNNFIYDLQLKINVIIQDNILNEEFLIFNFKVDLNSIKEEPEKSYLWYILGPILGLIFVGVVTFFIIKYIRLHKSNINLKEEMKSLAYSNDIQKNVLMKEHKDSQKESDYESTFI